MRRLLAKAEDMATLAQLAEEEGSDGEAREVESGLAEIEQMIAAQELRRLFHGEYDGHNALLSINAGAGGTESCDWVDMLARMYGRWAERHGYTWEIIDHTPGEEAGSRGITASIAGDHPYGRLRGERGVHRLVRISPFDAASRRHTSFASVDVMPEVEEADEVTINQDDLKVDTFRAAGAGGQHVNKTESAVRITHLPTGLAVAQQTEKSQHKNKAQAMKLLKARLYEAERERVDSARAAERKGQVGSGDRSERIRTYNFPQGRVTDHRINLTLYKLDRIISGDELGEIIDALVAEDQATRLAQLEQDDAA